MNSGTTANPCICCQSRIPVKLSCRQRGGTASLIGCAEFTSPSSPPKRYRRVEDSGSADGAQWTNSLCNGSPAGTDHCDYSGWRELAADGTLTFGGCTDCGAGCTPADIGCPTGFSDSCLVTWTISTTTAARITTTNCCVAGTQYRKDVADSLVVSISIEDTEANAITRLMAGAGATWTSWTPTGNGTLGTCLPQDCCKAQWQSRTTGFDLAYEEAQYRVVNYPLSLAGLTNYEIKVEIYRRMQGTSAIFTLYQTLSFPETTDIDGNFPSFDGDVPNDEGFETYSGAAYAILTP